jgi:hypothetical protein
MNIQIFSPVGIKPDDYRHRFPELERCSEFDNLPSRQLIFIWHYACQSSPLVLYTHDDYERAAEALKRSGFNPGKVEKDRILSLQFDSVTAIAIKRMSEFDPGARFKAFKMIQNIYDHYQTIIDLGPEAFKITTKQSKGDDVIETSEIDYKRYVDVSAKISDELPGLLAKLEEGFAIVNIAGEEVVDDESTALRDWQIKKDQ